MLPTSMASLAGTTTLTTQASATGIANATVVSLTVGFVVFTFSRAFLRW